jgi:transcriptional regulator with PAS, ATPase and Fis domain
MPRTSATSSLTTLLDRSNRPIYVVDERRRVVYCNAALAAWLDLEPAKIVGRLVEYHSEATETMGAPREDSPLTDLCPPPRALAGEPCDATISAMHRDGRLIHRRADFVPLGSSLDRTKSAKPADANAKMPPAVLVLLSADDLSPQEIALELSGEPTADELHRAIHQFRRAQSAHYEMHSLLGESSAMRKLRAQVAAAAASGANVLISGAPGSGRGHVARAVHYQTLGHAAPKLIPLRCERLSDDLLRRALESLHGTQGAIRQRPTLLLENLGRLAASHQAQLLTIIEKNSMPWRIIATIGRTNQGEHEAAYESRIEETLPPGSTAARSAKPRDLPADGTCDSLARIEPALLDAISTIAIEIPRLVERLEDLPILAQNFLEECNVGSSKQVGSIRHEALDSLALHSWPGELTELREVIAAAHRACISHEIVSTDLPTVVHHASQVAARSARRPERIVLDELLASIEKEVIQRALVQARGNKSEAADLLGMTRPRLYRRLVQLGLVVEAPAGPDIEQPEFVEQDPADHSS